MTKCSTYKIVLLAHVIIYTCCIPISRNLTLQQQFSVLQFRLRERNIKTIEIEAFGFKAKHLRYSNAKCVLFDFSVWTLFPVIFLYLSVRFCCCCWYCPFHCLSNAFFHFMHYISLWLFLFFNFFCASFVHWISYKFQILKDGKGFSFAILWIPDQTSVRWINEIKKEIDNPSNFFS